MRKIKLIAIDLDGTLIREDQSMSEIDKQAIFRVHDAGIPVVIATGRIFTATKRLLKDLRISTLAICCNGADICSGEGSQFIVKIDEEELSRAHDLIKKFDVQSYVFCDHKIYCTKKDINKRLFKKWDDPEGNNGTVVMCDDFESILKEVSGNATKFLVWTPDTSLHPAIWHETNNLSYFNVVNGEPLNFEFTKKGVSKGIALKELVQKMDISIDEVMAIGDSSNDLDMICAAGWGVAMGNAMQEIKDAADFITLPIEQNGVAHAINKLVFGE